MIHRLHSKPFSTRNGKFIPSKGSIVASVAIAGCLLSGAGGLQAANRTWSATAVAPGSWSVPANWGGTAPVAADALFFGASSTTTLTNDLTAGTVFNGVTFNAGAGAFNITGNSIGITGNVTNSSTTAEILNIPLVMTTAGRTFTTTAGGGDLSVGAVSGLFGLTKAGGGTLTLLGANSYTTTTINVGSLVYGSASVPAVTQTLTTLAVGAGNDANVTSVFGTGGGNSSLTFTSQTYTPGGTINYVTSGGANGTTNAIKLTAAAGLVSKQAFFDGADYAFMDATNTFVRAPIYGAAGVGGDANFASQASTGATLTGAMNNWVSSSIASQGTATITTLKINGASPVNLALTGTLADTTGGILVSGGTTSTISGGSVSTNSGISYVIRTDSAADNLTISSPIVNNVSGSASTLTKSGLGTLTLSGANTYTGTTFADNGILNMSGTFLTSLLSVNNPAATVNISGTNALTGSAAVTLGTNGGVINYSSSNNNTGTTTINGGTATVSASGAFGTGTISINAATIQTSGGTPLTFSNPITSNGNGPWNVNGNTDVTFSGLLGIAGANQINVNNTGVTNFAGGINLASTVPTGNRTTTLAGTGAITVSGNIVDGLTGGTPNNLLTYSGTNTLTLNGNNSFTGALAVTASGGTVKIGSGTALGFGGAENLTGSPSTVGQTTLAAGTTLDLGGQTVDEPIVLNGGSLVNNSGTSAKVDNGIAGIALALNGSSGLTAGSTVSISGTGTGATATINALGYASGSFALSAGGSAYKVGSTFAVTGPNSTGSQIIVTAIDVNGGITAFNVIPGSTTPSGAATAIGTGTNGTGASFTINPTPVYQVSSITTTNAGSGYTTVPTVTTSTGTFTNNAVLSSVTINNTSSIGGTGNISIPAVVSGGGGLTKTGAGTVSLGGVNTYAGVTTVSVGSLLVNGSHSTGGNYIVSAAGTLGGLGTIAPTGANTVAISGTLAPGDSVSGQTGTLTINSTGVNFANGSAFKVAIGGPSAGAFDQLALTNTGTTNISLTGTVALNLTWTGGSAPVSTDTYEIINRAGSGTWGGFFANAGEGTTVTFTNGYTGVITYQGGDGNDVFISNIQLVSVPEPPQVAVGVMAVLGAIIFLRRRRSSYAA